MDFLLNTMIMGQAAWLWAVFAVVVFTVVFIDLGVLHKEYRAIDIRESLYLSAGYIIVALLFGLFVWAQMGQTHAFDYYTGYVIEKSLSVDNLFVMAIIFSALNIPRKYQHRVLFWGIIGVLILRGIMIGLGAALVNEFEWILYLFAGFLIITGIKLVFLEEPDDDGDIKDNKIIQFITKKFRVTDIHEHKFFVRKTVGKKTKLFATPLFIALITIEIADVIFAVDSVPAIFSITTEPFIVYTSNIFAILGLRALFFSLSAMMERFEYLKYAVAIILIFIGSKVFIAPLLGLEKFPSAISLSVTLTLIIGGIVYSMYKTRNLDKKHNI